MLIRMKSWEELWFISIFFERMLELLKTLVPLLNPGFGTGIRKTLRYPPSIAWYKNEVAIMLQAHKSSLLGTRQHQQPDQNEILGLRSSRPLHGQSWCRGTRRDRLWIMQWVSHFFTFRQPDHRLHLWYFVSISGTDKDYTEVLYAYREREEVPCPPNIDREQDEKCYNLTGKLIFRVNSLPEDNQNQLDQLSYTIEVKPKGANNFIMPTVGDDGCSHLTTASGNRPGCPITVPDDDLDFTLTGVVTESEFVSTFQLTILTGFVLMILLIVTATNWAPSVQVLRSKTRWAPVSHCR